MYLTCVFLMGNPSVYDIMVFSWKYSCGIHKSEKHVSVVLSIYGARCSSMVRAFAHGAMGRRIDPSWGRPIDLFEPVLHDWCNKGCGMCYLVVGLVHIKEPLLLIGKSRPCGGSGFPLSVSEWSFTICPIPYN